MPRTAQFLTPARKQFLTGIALALIWALFATAHVASFETTGRVSLLIYAIAETLIAVFFMLRAEAKTIATNVIEWLVAVLGTFLSLLLRPTSDNLVPIAEWGLMLGSSMQVAGVLSLNRSFALVPALRELKTAGMYHLVRHPIYLSYFVSCSCYLLTNFSTSNLLVVIGSISLLLVRIYFEERHLSLNAEYRAYQERVRWRLIPFVY